MSRFLFFFFLRLWMIFGTRLSGIYMTQSTFSHDQEWFSWPAFGKYYYIMEYIHFRYKSLFAECCWFLWECWFKWMNVQVEPLANYWTSGEHGWNVELPLVSDGAAVTKICSSFSLDLSTFFFFFFPALHQLQKLLLWICDKGVAHFILGNDFFKWSTVRGHHFSVFRPHLKGSTSFHASSPLK